MNLDNHWNPESIDPKKFEGKNRKDFEEGSQGDVDRNYGQYEYFLGVDFKSMKGKNILDIGGGVTGKMSKEVAEEFGVKVVSMSPEYNTKEMLNETNPTDGTEARFIVGRAQEMPFKDNMFDYELALYSIPTYLPPVLSEYEKCFQEIVRTLKPGGRACIFPVKIYFSGEIDDSLVLKALESLSSEITYEHQYKRSSKGLNACLTITKIDSSQDKELH